MESLSPGGLALVLALARGGVHLTAEEYGQLATGPLAKEVMELRRNALLVPLAGRTEDRETVPVYWLPPDTYQLVRALAGIVDSPPQRIVEHVGAELRRIGYTPRPDTN